MLAAIPYSLSAQIYGQKTVAIAYPPNHAVFYAPVDIPLFAFTSPNALFSNVEFYANGIDLGPAVHLSASNAPGTITPDEMASGPLLRLRGTWYLVWTNPPAITPASSYTLTAVAKGIMTSGGFPDYAYGISATSTPVNITIVPSVDSTNLPDVVNIVANSPVAIAGTNSSCTWLGTTSATITWTNWPPASWTLFNSWGPRIAMFTIHRFGDAGAPLTVYYNIGGTASNGVDYFALPGNATIPAGYHAVMIPVVPIDNNGYNQFLPPAQPPVVAPKTVILTLKQPITLPPTTYLIGKPSSAEVVIYHDWLWPPPCVLPDGTFLFDDGGTNSGPDGAWFVIQSSRDLLHWTSIGTNQIFNGSMDCLDPDAMNHKSAYYRIVPLLNTPPQ